LVKIELISLDNIAQRLLQESEKVGGELVSIRNDFRELDMHLIITQGGNDLGMKKGRHVKLYLVQAIERFKIYISLL
jgi:hypothetical protein